MYENIKKNVLKANLAIKEYKLVIFTWGNVSLYDQNLGVVGIKPSGVPYEKMQADDIVIVDLDGNQLSGNLRPSVDLSTHLEVYKKHPQIRSIVHTHSTYATAWAQKNRNIPLYGTTHADYFKTDIPCARFLEASELDLYEKNTGIIIADSISSNPFETPACIVSGHGAFAWGKNTEESVHHAVVLEEIAKTAYLTETILGHNNLLPEHIRNLHYQRKHGKKAKYGQK